MKIAKFPHCGLSTVRNPNQAAHVCRKNIEIVNMIFLFQILKEVFKVYKDNWKLEKENQKMKEAKDEFLKNILKRKRKKGSLMTLQNVQGQHISSHVPVKSAVCLQKVPINGRTKIHNPMKPFSRPTEYQFTSPFQSKVQKTQYFLTLR